MSELQIEYIPIIEITPYDKNPRKNEKAVDHVVNSIKEFGFKNPIILDKNNIIVAGHTRFKAAQKLGLQQVPVIWADDLTEEQVKAFRIADNKTQEYADWDFKLLIEEFRDLKLKNINLELTGFSEAEINKILPDFLQEDSVPDVANPKYKIEKGDIYQLGDHRVMCGDSTISEDVSKLMNGQMIDAIVTDPPYGVDYAKKNEFLNQQDKGNRIQKAYANDEIDRDYRVFFNDVLGNSIKYLKEYNQIYVFTASTRLYDLQTSFKDLNLQTSIILVWVKNNHVMARTDYLPKHEFIVYGWKGKHKFYGKTPQSVFNYDKPMVNDLHPTMKPVKLMEDLIINASEKGMIIHEPFGGSGSTLIACEQTNRICYMMELDPLYVSVILERFENLTNQKAVKL